MKEERRVDIRGFPSGTKIEVETPEGRKVILMTERGAEVSE